MSQIDDLKAMPEFSVSRSFSFDDLQMRKASDGEPEAFRELAVRSQFP
jgi:hypothetical protein